MLELLAREVARAKQLMLILLPMSFTKLIIGLNSTGYIPTACPLQDQGFRGASTRAGNDARCTEGRLHSR